MLWALTAVTVVVLFILWMKNCMDTYRSAWKAAGIPPTLSPRAVVVRSIIAYVLLMIVPVVVTLALGWELEWLGPVILGGMLLSVLSQGLGAVGLFEPFGLVIGMLIGLAIEISTGAPNMVHHHTANDAPSIPVPRDPSPLTGKVGIVETRLNPSGKIRLDDASYDAISEGEFVEAGATVKILADAGYALRVRRCDAEAEEGQ